MPKELQPAPLIPVWRRPPYERPADAQPAPGARSVQVELVPGDVSPGVDAATLAAQRSLRALTTAMGQERGMLNRLAQEADIQYQTLPSSAQAFAQPPSHLGVQRSASTFAMRLEATLALLRARGNDGVSQHELTRAQGVSAITINRQMRTLRERGLTISTLEGQGRYILAEIPVKPQAGLPPVAEGVCDPAAGEHIAADVRLVLNSQGDGLVGLIGSPGDYLRHPLARTLAVLMDHPNQLVRTADLVRVTGTMPPTLSAGISHLRRLGLNLDISNFHGIGYSLVTQETDPTLALLRAHPGQVVPPRDLIIPGDVASTVERRIGVLQGRGFEIMRTPLGFRLMSGAGGIKSNPRIGNPGAPPANRPQPPARADASIQMPPENGEYKAGNLRLILNSEGESLIEIVGSPGEHLHLPPRDAQVLAVLIKHRYHGVRADDICGAIGSTHLSVKAAISRLQKLELGVVIRHIEGAYRLATQGSPASE